MTDRIQNCTFSAAVTRISSPSVNPRWRAAILTNAKVWEEVKAVRRELEGKRSR